VKFGEEASTLDTLAGFLEKTAISSCVIFMQLLVAAAQTKLEGVILPAAVPPQRTAQPPQAPRPQQGNLNWGEPVKDTSSRVADILSNYR
jgi:hypothetical protein